MTTTGPSAQVARADEVMANLLAWREVRITLELSLLFDLHAGTTRQLPTLAFHTRNEAGRWSSKPAFKLLPNAEQQGEDCMVAALFESVAQLLRHRDAEGRDGH